VQLQELVIAALAVEGLVELIHGAEILRGPRDWLKRRSIFFKRLLECKYCLSVWCAGAVLAMWLGTRQVPQAIWPVWLLALHRAANRVHDVLDLIVQAKFQLYFTRKRLEERR